MTSPQRTKVVGEGQEPERRVRLDRYRERPAVYLESDRLARIVAGTVAVVMVAGVGLWASEGWSRFNVPDAVRPDWFRWAQVLLAVAGLAAAITEIVYLVHFTVTGYTWRRWRGVAITFAVLAASWTAMWWADRLLMDHFYLD